MFEASLVESSPFRQARSRWPAILSFAIQALIVTTLIAIPLLHPEVLPLTLPKLELVAPRYRPPTPPLPIKPVHVQTSSSSSAISTPTPTAVATQAPHTDAHPLDAPTLPIGLNIGETGANRLSSLLATSPHGARVTVAGPSTAAAGPSTPMRITTGVLAGMLLGPIRPQYPAIAKISHTEGTVIVDATISRTGNIESAHVVSGPEMLRAAALQAVRDARYRPFLLNGEPTEVATTISINFRLGSG